MRISKQNWRDQYISYMIAKGFRLSEYISDGRSLYVEWLESLPTEAQTRIDARIFRVRCGNLGDYSAVGHGVSELRIHFGPGYRVYFAFASGNKIVLLGGGDKKSQRRDIIAARCRWIEYRRRS